MAPAGHFTVLCAAVLFAAAQIHAAEANKDAPPAPPAPTATAPALTPAAGTSPARSAAPAPVAAPKTEGKPVTLPVFQVSGARLREIDLQIKKLEKLVDREKKLLEKSALDDTLNDEKVSKAASLFGGKSAAQRESVAAVRVESMEKELDLLGKLRTPLTKNDRALIEKLVDDERTYRRNLDEALR